MKAVFTGAQTTQHWHASRPDGLKNIGLALAYAKPIQKNRANIRQLKKGHIAFTCLALP